MTLSGLAFAYARRRPLATMLVVVLAALGVAIAVLTLILSNELESRMRRDAEGIDLVVGAKGSPLQLVLAGVYHADSPPGNIPYTALAALRANPQVASAIPLALGDSVGGFRIVGTEPAFVEHYGASLAQGAMFGAPLEAVIGSEVARESGLALGGEFEGTHGLAAGGGAHADHDYKVVGVLAPTGRVVDRLVLTPLESVWAVHAVHPTRVVAGDHREITMILVRYATPLAAATLAREINGQSALVAASPALETARLFTVFGVGLDLVRVFAGVLVGASILLLFVALAQALEERRYDLAILRALGARRRDLVFVLMAESVALALAGAALGVAIGHVAAASIGAWIPAAAPLAGAAWRFTGYEGLVVALAVAGGILAACWPAWRASRLDVAATLSDA
ncbi:MAG TPA: FtsX-like permease family protein [Casimicrobiaceae bacterium]|jgi:putative ABC transport system permease protein